MLSGILDIVSNAVCQVACCLVFLILSVMPSRLSGGMLSGIRDIVSNAVCQVACCLVFLILSAMPSVRWHAVWYS